LEWANPFAQARVSIYDGAGVAKKHRTLVLAHFWRRILDFSVTAHPAAEWTAAGSSGQTSENK
jgi:hypothetical protein